MLGFSLEYNFSSGTAVRSPDLAIFGTPQIYTRKVTTQKPLAWMIVEGTAVQKTIEINKKHETRSGHQWVNLLLPGGQNITV